MIIRQFALHSGTGTSRTTKSLNTGEYVFTNPSGLGYTISPETINLDNGFFLRTKTDTLPVNNIVGDLLVKGSTRDAAIAYRELVSWIAAANTADELYFEYQTDETHTFECKVALDYVQKTEKDGINLLCPISFVMLTPWYVSYTITMTKTSSHSSGDAFTFTTAVASGGDIPSGLRLKTSTFVAPAELTVGAVYAGSSISGGGFVADLSDYAGDTISLDYSSYAEDRHIYIIDSDDVVHNIIDLVDITDDIWVDIPTDVGFAVVISCSDVVSGRDMTGDFNTRIYYRAV